MAQSHSRGLLYTAPPAAESNRDDSPQADESEANRSDEPHASDTVEADQSKPTAPADD